jgi:biopolymer transport protein ExbD
MRVISMVLVMVVILAGFLISAPFSKGDHEDIAEGPIVVDEHWVDVIQREDKTTLEVDEFFFINNTGTEPYSGDFYLWLDDKSEIIAKCCGNAPNMACRYQNGGSMACFDFGITEENIFKGGPFFSNDLISYYNQNEWIRIIAQSRDNISYTSTINLNVILGGSSVLRDPEGNISEVPILFTSDHDVLGISFELDKNMPNNITVFENLKIMNNGTKDVSMNFTLDGIPMGWSAEILNYSDPKTDITLSPLEEANLTLKLIVPSYIAPIRVSYITKIESEDNDETKGTFVKQYLYDSKRVEYFIFALSDKGVTISSDLRVVHPTAQGEPELNEKYNRYWYVAQSFNVLADSKSTITLDWENSQDPLPILAILLLAIIIALLIGVPLVRRSRNMTKNSGNEAMDSSADKAAVSVLVGESNKRKIDDKKPQTRQKTEKKSKMTGEKRVQSLKMLINRLEVDHKDGILSDQTYEELDNKYKDKLHLAEEKLKRERDLNSKGKRIDLAIERLNKDRKEGLLDDYTYSRLLDDYKKVKEDLQKK